MNQRQNTIKSFADSEEQNHKKHKANEAKRRRMGEWIVIEEGGFG